MDLSKWLFNGHDLGKFADKPITDLISAILPNIFIIAGLILLFYAVFGGLKIIAGGGDPKSTDSGKQALTHAAIGFLIIFTSYWLVQIIEILTGVNIL